MSVSYHRRFCRDVVEFFSHMKTDSTGKIVGAPSFLSFAETLGTSPETLAAWRIDHEEFDAACRHAWEALRIQLIDCALSERVNVSVAKFLLSDLFGMDREAGAGAAAREGASLSEGDRRLISHLIQRLEGASAPKKDLSGESDGSRKGAVG